jgi:glutamine amidotransferase
VSDPDVVIIDSGGANLASLRFALDRLDARSLISADPALVASAPRLILPGVGAAGDAMARLHAAGLVECIRAFHRPLLGICLGMQLLYAHSDEQDTQGLGLIPGSVRKIPAAPGQPVPHMGWNTCRLLQPDPLLAGVNPDDYFYFVHSYAAPVCAYTSATTDYGGNFSAVVQRDNYHGAQFHPERSAGAGARVLQNFLQLRCC